MTSVTSNKAIIVAFIGSRGVPSSYGGFETFVSEISEILSSKGIEVMIQCEKQENGINNVTDNKLYFSSIRKSNNQLRYYFEGLRWGLKSADIVIVTGSGGAPFYFLNIFRNKTIITNTDGLEHKRTKWNRLVRCYLKASEFLSVLFSNYLIADSHAIYSYLTSSYRFKASNKIKIIEYGAHLNKSRDESVLEKYSLADRCYYLIVARMEPENNIQMILEAYKSAGVKYQMIVIGNYNENQYGRKLFEKYKSQNVRFLGGIYSKHELSALRYSCKAYFHGHSVGGTNPSLLEAMASGNLTVCHDNVFNRETTDSSQMYFSNVNECLSRFIEIEKMSHAELKGYSEKSRIRVEEFYQWSNIGNKYLSLISEISRNRKKVY